MMVSCEWSEWVSVYIDGEMKDAERERFEDHMEHCSECRTLADDFLGLKSQVFAAYQACEIPQGLEDRIGEALRAEAWAASAPVMRSIWLLLPIGTAALGLTAFLFWAAVIYRTGSVILKVLWHLLYASGSLVSFSSPIISGMVAASVLIMLLSGFSLRHLLKAAVV